nr:hypothetical protein [Tanacetum cinerariifolium]
EAIPLGRPYRTRPNGPRRVMTITAHLLLVHLRILTSLFFGFWMHQVRLGYTPVRAPRHSEAFHHWCAAIFTSESSLGDSSESPLHSSSHSTGPSCKRCWSPTDSVQSFALVIGSLALTRFDLLPPRKRDDVRDHIEADPKDDMEEFEEIIEPVRGDSSSSSDTRNGTVRSVEDIPVDLDDAIRDFYHHMSEVRVDRIVRIETTQRQLEANQMIASGERAGMAESIRSLRLENLKIHDNRDDLRRKLKRLESFTKRQRAYEADDRSVLPKKRDLKDGNRVVEFIDSDSPDEMASLEYITPLPATSPFLFTDSFVDSNPFDVSDSSKAPPSQDPYVTTIAHWRSRIIAHLLLVQLRILTSLFFRFWMHQVRLGYTPVRAPRHSEAFHHWCAAIFTSESSLGDSSESPLHLSSHSTGPSRKRCWSPTDSVQSFALVIGSLALTRADLLPPRKRDDVRDHIEADPKDDMEEFEVSAGDTVVLGIDPRSVPMVDQEIIEPVRGDSSSSSGTRDGTVWSVEDIPVDLDDAIRDSYHHMSEVRVDKIVRIETTQRQLEANQMIASGERAGMAESIRSLRSENLKIHDNRDDLRRKLKRLESFTKRRLGFRP